MAVNMDLDKEMLFAFPLFIIAVGANLEIFSLGIGFLTDELFVLGNASITVARVVAIGSIGYIIVNRDESIRDTKGVDIWIVYATIGLILTPPFMPVLENTLVSPGIAFFAFIGQIMGFFLASALN